MVARCPSCEAELPHPVADGGSCELCGHLWAPAARGTARPEAPIEFEVQYAVGDAVKGPYDINRIRQQVYLGYLTGDERVRVPGEAFQPLSNRPEFADVLALGERKAPAARGTLSRWKPATRGSAPAPALGGDDGLGAAFAPPAPARVAPVPVAPAAVAPASVAPVPVAPARVAPAPASAAPGPREFTVEEPRPTGRKVGVALVVVGLGLLGLTVVALAVGAWWFTRG